MNFLYFFYTTKKFLFIEPMHINTLLKNHHFFGLAYINKKLLLLYYYITNKILYKYARL